jgi:hypothetical protein
MEYSLLQLDAQCSVHSVDIPKVELWYQEVHKVSSLVVLFVLRFVLLVVRRSLLCLTSLALQSRRGIEKRARNLNRLPQCSSNTFSTFSFFDGFLQNRNSKSENSKWIL